MAGGFDIFARQNLASSYVSYDTETIGGNLRLGFALTEQLALQPHYSLYRQEVKLSDAVNCWPQSGTCFPAALPVRLELADGPVMTSLVGYTLTYNTLDNVNSPTSGLLAKITNDFAGVGGDVNFIRTTGEVRKYYEVVPDVVSVVKLQGGHVGAWGGKDLRMLDHFQMGPNLVRGFATAGIGPRDLTNGSSNDALGGSMFWGASVEMQTPLYFLPKEIGIRVAAFADAGSLWDYTGPTSGSAPAGSPTQTLLVGLDGFEKIRSSAGVGLIWDSPLGPLRFDLAFPFTKYCSTAGGAEVCDQEQVFRFSGGTKF